MNTLLYFFANLRAASHCRNAHRITNSGAITAVTISRSRRKPAMNRFSSASGMLGWTATQVQPKIVTTQLHIIFQTVLQLCISLHKAGADWSMVWSARIGNAWAFLLARKWIVSAINMSCFLGPGLLGSLLYLHTAVFRSALLCHFRQNLIRQAGLARWNCRRLCGRLFGKE